jgi:hypothetical protein
MSRPWAVLLGFLATLTLAGVASTTTVDAASFAYDLSTSARVDVRHSSDAPAAETQVTAALQVSASPSVEARGASTSSSATFLATNTVDDVIAETTNATSRNLTSAHTLTADEALDAGQQWVGDGYTELGKPGSGVFRSADGTRQFRIDDGSLTGSHAPGVPHVHLETYAPGARIPSVNNHIPFVN